MEITTNLLSNAFQSQQPLIIASIITLLSLLLTLRSFIKKPPASASSSSSSSSSSASLDKKEGTRPTPSCNGTADTLDLYAGASTQEVMALADIKPAPVIERQTGASMMEQLVPEITTHALSYLDYPSLCRLSMTNSLMRKAANDDNAWKALYHKDFTLEQDSVTPVNGWKAYYAATRAIMSVNTEFFNIIRERSSAAMSHFWLNADYVKCILATGEHFSGYNAVIESWDLRFSWEQWFDFQVRDVRARVLTDMAWVTMKIYFEMNGSFNMTNVFEFHNGRWYMVHHHSSVMVADGDVEQQFGHGLG